MERDDVAGMEEDSCPRDFPPGKGEKVKYFLAPHTDIVQLFPERASILKHISVSATVIHEGNSMSFGRIDFEDWKIGLFGNNASIKGEVGQSFVKDI